MKIEESHIIITGGAGNIGSILTIELAGKAASILILDIKPPKQTFEMNNVIFQKLDITCEKKVKDFFANLPEKKYNVLINNAGKIFNRPLVNILNKSSAVHPLSEFNEILNINLNGTFLMGSNFAYYMIKNKIRGCIINISSITAKGNLGQSAYSASKAAVESLSRTWSKELGMFKIRSAAIAPGFIDTDSTHENLSENTIKKYKRDIALKKLGSVKDIANGIEFIITNDYYTGEVIKLNGGLSI